MYNLKSQQFLHGFIFFYFCMISHGLSFFPWTFFLSIFQTQNHYYFSTYLLGAFSSMSIKALFAHSYRYIWCNDLGIQAFR